jgi:hypothetical protein
VAHRPHGHQRHRGQRRLRPQGVHLMNPFRQ